MAHIHVKKEFQFLGLDRKDMAAMGRAFAAYLQELEGAQTTPNMPNVEEDRRIIGNLLQGINNETR